MRIILLECHSISEYLGVSLFSEMGHYVFPMGYYINPANPGDSMRPALPNLKLEESDIDHWTALKGKHDDERKSNLTAELLDRFDVVIVMHTPNWIIDNWEVLRGRKVIWRTIGQSGTGTEALMKPYRDDGLKIVRYSPREARIPGYIGHDAIIRFYVDEEEFKGWTGEIEEVVTFNQGMPERGGACNYDLYCKVMQGLPHNLYGPGNELAGPCNRGRVSYEELKLAMRQHRAYFYVGTHPASYTLNLLEAGATGIPIVAVGPRHGNSQGSDLYEVPDIFTNGVNAFYSDSAAQLRWHLQDLLKDRERAKAIGGAGRERIVELFGKQTIKLQWDQFLRTL